MIGECIAHFCVTEKIGEGGMGEVYRAHGSELRLNSLSRVDPEPELGVSCGDLIRPTILLRNSYWDPVQSNASTKEREES